MKYHLDKSKTSWNEYLLTMDATRNSTAAVDVMSSEFDITWAFDDRYNHTKTITMNPVENNAGQVDVYDDGSVVYEYNNEWFRSDNFTDSHEKKNHILFAGCSETEGIGGRLDTVWTKMLHESLKEKYDVDGFYSIARAGYGWQKIITNFMTYVKKYGVPTHLFVLMPNIDRMFEWNTEKKSWFYTQKFPVFAGKPIEEEHKDRVATAKEHMKMLIDFTVSWNLFEQYCKSIGTKLLWSSWDFVETYNLSMFDQHENFFVVEGKEFYDYILEKRPDGKTYKDDLERRDGHSGVLFHMFWKEKFEEEIERRGLLND
jgi:hypothetical protein